MSKIEEDSRSDLEKAMQPTCKTKQLHLTISVIVGATLCMMYMWCRFSDFARAMDDLVVERSDDSKYWIVTLTTVGEKTKTGHDPSRAAKKVIFLGPVVGVTGRDFSEPLVRARQDLGMSHERNRCVLLYLLVNGTFGAARMKMSTYNAWLRTYLSRRCRVSAQDAKGYASHSCKRTLLPYACKAGMRPADRRALGYHRKPGDSTLGTYGVDELAPCQRLHALVLLIRKRKFDQDAARTGRWSCDKSMIREEEVRSETGSEQETDNSDSASSESEVVEICIPPMAVIPRRMPPGFEISIILRTNYANFACVNGHKTVCSCDNHGARFKSVRDQDLPLALEESRMILSYSEFSYAMIGPCVSHCSWHRSMRID